jgi:hypothetical protein
MANLIFFSITLVAKMSVILHKPYYLIEAKFETSEPE